MATTPNWSFMRCFGNHHFCTLISFSASEKNNYSWEWSFLVKYFKTKVYRNASRTYFFLLVVSEFYKYVLPSMDFLPCLFLFFFFFFFFFSLKNKTHESVRGFMYPENIYLFKVHNRNSRKRCEICSKVTMEPKRHQCRHSSVLLLTLNIFHTLFSVSIAGFEQLNVFLVNPSYYKKIPILRWFVKLRCYELRAVSYNETVSELRAISI